MKILFCTSNLPGALLIRSVTWSTWSHVAIILDDNMVLEAVWPRVRITTLDSIKQSHKNWCIVDIPVLNEDIALEFCMKQVGKPYDTSALFGLLAHRDWGEDDSWFCSELAAATLEAGGLFIFRHEYIHRIVPHDLWKLNYKILEDNNGRYY